MQHMNWNELRIFLNVARHGNLVNAARALKIDPTTVSRRISSLEDDLQQTLFERTGEGFALTAYGRTLMTHAEDMEAAANRIEHAGPHPGQLSGQLRISVSEGFGTHVIAPRLAKFAAAHPGLTVDLVASSGFLNPSKREADLAILLTRPRRGPLKIRKLSDYDLGVYAPRLHPEWSGITLPASFHDSAIPFVGYVPDFIYAPELRYLDEIEGGLEPDIRCSSINAQREIIAGGGGIGVLPCFMANDDPRLVRIFPEKSIRRSFWLAVHRDIANLPRVRAFIDWLTQMVAEEAALLEGSR